MTLSPAPRNQIDADRLQEIPAALEEIEARGHLLVIAPDRLQRLALMQALSQRGFLIWNRVLTKYQLTPLGQEFLVRHHDAIAASRVRAATG
jgi:hypothetical protein